MKHDSIKFARSYSLRNDREQKILHSVVIFLVIVSCCLFLQNYSTFSVTEEESYHVSIGYQWRKDVLQRVHQCVLGRRGVKRDAGRDVAREVERGVICYQPLLFDTFPMIGAISTIFVEMNDDANDDVTRIELSSMAGMQRSKELHIRRGAKIINENILSTRIVIFVMSLLSLYSLFKVLQALNVRSRDHNRKSNAPLYAVIAYQMMLLKWNEFGLVSVKVGVAAFMIFAFDVCLRAYMRKLWSDFLIVGIVLGVLYFVGGISMMIMPIMPLAFIMMESDIAIFIAKRQKFRRIKADRGDAASDAQSDGRGVNVKSESEVKEEGGALAFVKPCLCILGMGFMLWLGHGFSLLPNLDIQLLLIDACTAFDRAFNAKTALNVPHQIRVPLFEILLKMERLLFAIEMPEQCYLLGEIVSCQNYVARVMNFCKEVPLLALAGVMIFWKQLEIRFKCAILIATIFGAICYIVLFSGFSRVSEGYITECGLLSIMTIVVTLFISGYAIAMKRVVKVVLSRWSRRNRNSLSKRNARYCKVICCEKGMSNRYGFAVGIVVNILIIGCILCANEIFPRTLIARADNRKYLLKELVEVQNLVKREGGDANRRICLLCYDLCPLPDAFTEHMMRSMQSNCNVVERKSRLEAKSRKCFRKALRVVDCYSEKKMKLAMKRCDCLIVSDADRIGGADELHLSSDLWRQQKLKYGYSLYLRS